VRSLIRPQPFLDEIDLSYLGRVIRLNDFKNEKEAIAFLYEIFGNKEVARNRVSKADLLAKVASCSLENFTQMHTTRPLRRGIASYCPDEIHGGNDESTLNATAVQNNYEMAYFCRKCVSDDLKLSGMSYWRRAHQIPGRLWCSMHNSVLSSVSSKIAFLTEPSAYFDANSVISDEKFLELKNNQFVMNFLEISRLLYLRNKPLNLRATTPILGDIAKERGFQAYSGNTKSDLISDHINSVFPKWWLEMIFPDLVRKPYGKQLHKIDGVLYMRTLSSTVTAYLLVISVLFESAEVAMNKLNHVYINGTGENSIKRNVYQLPPEKDLVETYIEARGNHQVASEKLKLPIYIVIRAMRKIGLPSLSSDILANALVLFYLCKQSIVRSIKLSGVNEYRFENAIRETGGNMVLALEKIFSLEKQFDKDVFLENYLKNYSSPRVK